jgi:hypothetical protein
MIYVIGDEDDEVAHKRFCKSVGREVRHALLPASQQTLTPILNVPGRDSPWLWADCLPGGRSYHS